MTPLDRAKSLLEGDTVIAIINGDNALTSSRRGIGALLEYANSGALRGASVADKIVGKAAALLMVYGGVKEVYAGVVSLEAKRVFSGYGIPCSFEVAADNILNRAGTGICPMEETVQTIFEPAEAITAISKKLEELIRNQKK